MPAPTLPTKIGRYPVVRLLGRGAMGSVYLARDTELDRDVAIKTVRNLGTTDEERESFLVRFRNEARAVGRLKHPSIVAVYDVGTDDHEGPYLVFEYVEGATLKDVLRAKGPLSPTSLLLLAEQVGDALELAHREGIIHRDIKPENLLVANDGITRLLDFGVARVPDAALTGEGQFLGTPCYGAPEMLRGGIATPLSDQFSFAAVLYEAASGERAFPGNEALAVAHSVIHDEPRPVSEVCKERGLVPKAVDAVLAKGLEKKPAERYPSIALLVSALRAAYASAGVVRAPEAADTVPLMHLTRPRISKPEVVTKKRLVLWPFAAAFVVCAAVMFQLAPSSPSAAGAISDAPTGDDARGERRDPNAQQEGEDALTDANLSATKVDASVAAASAKDGGAGALKVETLSAFEREERAKDALERAQRALESGDKEAARLALDEAFRYDPEQPDIEILRRKL